MAIYPPLLQAMLAVFYNGYDWVPYAALGLSALVVGIAESQGDLSGRLLSASWLIYLPLLLLGYLLSPQALELNGPVCVRGIAQLQQFCAVFSDAWNVLDESARLHADLPRLLTLWLWPTVALLNVLMRICVRRAP